MAVWRRECNYDEMQKLVLRHADSLNFSLRNQSRRSEASPILLSTLSYFHEISRATGPYLTRGRARTLPWCAVNHRRNDWASRSPGRGKFGVVIMIEVAIEEMVGSDRVLDTND